MFKAHDSSHNNRSYEVSRTSLSTPNPADPVRSGLSRSAGRLRVVLLLVLCLVAVGCGSGDEGSTEPTAEPQETTGGQMEQGQATGPEIPEDAETVSGLDAAAEAEETAAGWQPDAALYAVSALTPADGEGLAQGWLYTYVSESAGAVASIAVAGGGEPELDEENGVQELPEVDIQTLSENTLEDPEALIDSDEAMQQSEEVGPYLQENPGEESGVGLDSISSGEAVWILSAARDGERLEEQIPAAG